MTDHELLQRYVREGDQGAFEELVRRYVDLVYSTARRRVGELAEDVTQNVFFLLARKGGRISEKVVMAGWLYRAARNVSEDVMKAEKRRRGREWAAAKERVVKSGETEWEKIGPVLEGAMDRLGRADRDAILLRYFKGMEIGEVAGVMGLPMGVVSKRLQRAVEKLRGRLAEKGIECPADVLGGAMMGNAVKPAGVEVMRAVMKPTGAGVKIIGGGMMVKAAVILIGMMGVVVAGVVYWRGGISKRAPQAGPLNGGGVGVALNPVSVEQERVIRAQIYRLEHYTVFAMTDQWAGAIRKLVEIGRPAVPELVAALDRTDNDMTLRAMGFALRAIGDPRACPALIRALGRTSVQSSSYGVNLTDKSLVDFMLAHQMEPGNGEVIYDPAVDEIMKALETITHHREGRWDIYSIDANNDSPAQMSAARARHVELSKLWMSWWDANGSKIVRESEMASLTAVDHGAQKVEEAGEAVWGPLFPTGQGFHLSKVRDVRVAVWDDRIDTKCLVDFDREPGVFSPLESVEWIKAGVKNSDFGPSIWYRSDGAGADGYANERVIVPPEHQKRTSGAVISYDAKDPAVQHIYGLYGQDVEVWQVAESMWEELPGMMEGGKDVKLDVTGPGSDFEWRDDRTGRTDAAHRPATFVFRTREGGAGIVQVLEGSKELKEAHIRYRVVERDGKPAAVPRRDVVEERGSFSEVKEVELRATDSGSASAIDLDTEKVFVAPAGETDPKGSTEWVRKLHADAVTVPWYQSTKLAGLRMQDVICWKISDGAFETISPGLLDAALNHLMPRDEQGVMGGATVIFRTGDGGEGMLQVLSVSEAGVRFRYKVVLKGGCWGR